MALCVGKENDLCNKHKDYKSKVSDLEEQFDIISKDSSSLENSFDELHHHYLRLKAVHQKLSASNKILNQHLAELRDWEREDTDYTITLQRELQEIEMRCVWGGAGPPVSFVEPREDSFMHRICLISHVLLCSGISLSGLYRIIAALELEKKVPQIMHNDISVDFDSITTCVVGV